MRLIDVIKKIAYAGLGSVRFLWVLLIICALGLVPSLGVFTSNLGDYEYKEGDFVLETTVDKTDFSVGDTVEITITFKNMSDRSLPICIYAPVGFGTKLDEIFNIEVRIPDKFEHYGYADARIHKWYIRTLKKNACITFKSNYVVKYNYDLVVVSSASFYLGKDKEKSNKDKLVYVTYESDKLNVIEGN